MGTDQGREHRHGRGAGGRGARHGHRGGQRHPALSARAGRSSAWGTLGPLGALALAGLLALAAAPGELRAAVGSNGARLHAPSGRQLGMRLDAAEGRILPVSLELHARVEKDCILVNRVVDGDTLRLGNGEKVRLIGVDTPETKHPRKPVEPLGPEAAAFTKREIEHRLVRLERDTAARDRYGRLLAYVYRKPDGMLLNAALVRAGLSPAYTRYPFRMKGEFVALETEARREGLGLWEGQRPPPVPEPPAPTVSPNAPPPAAAPAAPRVERQPAPPPPPRQLARQQEPPGDCRIKGNIGSDKSRIYHTPESPWYGRTKIDQDQGERWFCTETEARAAGWRPPRE